MQPFERPGAGRTIDAAPVGPAERLQSLDVLRGVAVLGILVMNVYAFAMPLAAYANPLVMGGQEWYNLGTWFITHALFDQKFMSIFSMLFGAGIVLMMRRADEGEPRLRQLYFRRHSWLLVIGALHAYLLWFGDILFFYAVTGMLVFLFRRATVRTLVVGGVLFLLVGLVLAQGTSRYLDGLRSESNELMSRQAAGEILDAEQEATLDTWQELRKTFAPTPAEIRADVDAYRGSYAGIVAYRAPEVAAMQLQALPFFIVWRVGGLMLLGMALMRLDLLSGNAKAGNYRWMIWLGYGLGLPMTVFSGVNAWSHQFDNIYMFGPGGMPNYVGSILVAFGHTGLVLLFVRSGRPARLLSRFGAVGRMALSNYLLHSLVMTTIFYGYGLGLYGQVPRFWQMGFVAGLAGVQLLASPWWLARYRFGPVEWAWRSLTYGRRQPMARAPG